MTRPRTDELAYVASRLDALRERRPSPIDVVLAGDGYPASEVSAELGVPVLASVPDDPAGAAALGGRPARRRQMSRHGIAQAATQIAEQLTSAEGAAVARGESRLARVQAMAR